MLCSAASMDNLNHSDGCFGVWIGVLTICDIVGMNQSGVPRKVWGLICTMWLKVSLLNLYLYLNLFLNTFGCDSTYLLILVVLFVLVVVNIRRNFS